MDAATSDSILNVFYRDPTAFDILRSYMPLIKVALIAYAGVYAPPLPKFACNFFRNAAFRAGVLVTLAFLITYDVHLALALGITLSFVLNKALRYDYTEVMAGTACDAHRD